jgi:dipeptidyl aminopeptidase/acylaminoacyl peptidase
LPDWKRVLATRSPAVGDSSAVVVLSGETGELLATIGPGVSLQYLPNDDVVYLSSEGAPTSIHLDPRTLKATTPAAPLVVSGVPRYSIFARTVLAAVSQSGTMAFSSGGVFNNEMLIATADGKVTPLPLGMRAFRGPRFSPDGKRIAVDVEPGGDLIGDVWIYDREAGTFARLTFEGGSVFPEWTPDGRSVLYSSNGPRSTGDRDLYVVPADRSAPPRIVMHGTAPLFEGVGSPTGGPLFLRTNAQGSGRDILVSRDGGKPVPFAAGPGEERSLALSPDGHFVLYTSNESGTDEVYLRRADGVGQTQVSTAGGTEPRWAPNGREAFYWAGDTLFAVPVTTGTSLAVGARRRVLVGTYARESYHTNYDVAPDGKTFVMIRGGGERAGSEITVLVNWLDVSRGATRK